MKPPEQHADDQAHYLGYRFGWLGQQTTVRLDRRLQGAPEVETLRRYFDVVETPDLEASDLTMTRRDAHREPFPERLGSGASFALYFGERGLERPPGGNGRVVVDTRRQRTVAFTPRGIEYSFWTGDHDDRWMIGRLVREKLVQRVLAHGGVRLHAGLAGNSSHGILLVGTSGSGKTSTLLHLLRVPGAAFTGADRVVVRDQGSLVGHGVPIATQIGTDLAATVPGLHQQAVAAQSRRFPRTPRATTDAFSKFSFLPGELVDALAIPLEPAVPVSLVVVPDLGERPGTEPSTHAIDRSEREAILAGEMLHPDPAFPAGVVGETESRPSASAQARLLETTWIRVRGDYRDPRVADAVLADLPGSGR